MNNKLQDLGDTIASSSRFGKIMILAIIIVLLIHIYFSNIVFKDQMSQFAGVYTDSFLVYSYSSLRYSVYSSQLNIVAITSLLFILLIIIFFLKVSISDNHNFGVKVLSIESLVFNIIIILFILELLLLLDLAFPEVFLSMSLVYSSVLRYRLENNVSDISALRYTHFLLDNLFLVFVLLLIAVLISFFIITVLVRTVKKFFRFGEFTRCQINTGKVIQAERNSNRVIQCNF